MLGYLVRRFILAVFTVWAISILSFAIIQLPPGDYVDAYIAQLAASGSLVSAQEAENLRIQYGLDQPIYVQYLKWVTLAAQGNFGMAMEWRRPVTEVIGDRLALTMVVSIFALIFTWAIALPIGIYSAVRQYSIGTVGVSPAVMGVRIVKNNLGNVPARQFNGQHGRTPAAMHPTTLYFKS